ncbi:MAG TPA: Yip1 family protein [Cyclobacteriaceae bacterium]|jgi:hypothetical protein|nr:Yip1 family protein [Cyclobacteriaceae bacterium]
MDDILDERIEEDNLSDRDIFTNIWTSPRQILKYINDNRYNKYVTILLLLEGISGAFNRAYIKDLGEYMYLWGIILVCVFLGGPLGWILYYIYAASLSWTGRWLKGQGNKSSLLTMLSYAMTPLIVALIFFILQIIIYGHQLFVPYKDFINGGLTSYIFIYGSTGIRLFSEILTIIFCVIGVSEVQKFSIAKSILNLLLAALVMFVPIFIIATLVRTF